MADKIEINIVELEKNKENLNNLKQELQEASDNSGYVSTPMGKFQSKNGIEALSRGQTVSAVSGLDTYAYMSILAWKVAITNLSGFVEKTLETFSEADQ